MVDFQSRDTRRDEAADSSGAEPPDETGADAPADGSDSDETDPDEVASAGDSGDGVLGFAVVTVGSERSVADDTAGDAVRAAVGETGEVVTREVIDDRYDGVQSTVGSVAERGDVDVLVTVGGTGVEPDDVTVDAVQPLLDKHLPGVGELIRRGFDDPASVRTRTMGGVIDGVPVFCLPGDPDLARTAATEVVVPEAGTLADRAALPTVEE